MNKEEILKMEAVDLKVAVAQEVMGWEFKRERKWGWYIDKQFMASSWWSPSTDIPAAWQVVERMRSMEDGEGNPLLCCLTIYSDHDLCWDIRWCYSELSNRNDGHKTHRLPTCFDEFPEAICKAALIARLAEIKRLEEAQR